MLYDMTQKIVKLWKFAQLIEFCELSRAKQNHILKDNGKKRCK